MNRDKKIIVLVKGDRAANSLKGDLFSTVISMLSDAGYSLDYFIVGGGGSQKGFMAAAKSILWIALNCLPRISPIMLPFAITNAQMLREIGAMVGRGEKHGLCLAISSCNDSGFAAHVIHAVTKIPYAVWEHQTSYQRGSLSWHAKAMRRITLRKAARAIAVSPELGRSIVAALGTPDLQVTTIPNPVPQRFLAPLQQADPDRPFTFGAWTRWRAIKRVDILLKAFSQLLERGHAVQLKIAGPPENLVKEAMGNIISPAHQQAVQYVGTVARENMVQFVDGCDCCVIPSDHETFGLPAIESMARGKPVVATRCGGPESIISNPAHGRIVKAGDVDALADAMEQILLARSKIDRAAIRAYCEEKFMPYKVQKKWVDLVDSID